ncbi:MAG TPA: 3-dehydroquinate synthase [Gemmatales bacterium]|nr:3-dehydroquinate synthase [Gemmatales bacterium]
MATIPVELGIRRYGIELRHDAADQFQEWLHQITPASRLVLIYDKNVTGHARDLLEHVSATPLEVPPGEEQKSLSRLSLLYDQLAAIPADRQTVILALGGGVLGDLAGYAAASFLRGLRLIMIPTTLLAMVDSSVGGKVGINHPAGKNLIGAFHQPAGVWIDTRYLSTLPGREYRSGLAEVVKYGMIQDGTFFTWLEQQAEAILAQHADVLEQLISQCCRLKASVVEKDEYETTGLRAILNYGHTLGHALEKVTGYGRLLHGEAVAIGMVFATRLAVHLHMVEEQIVERLVQLLQKFQLPTEPEAGLSTADLLEAMRHDKKNTGGKLRFVLPSDVGRVVTGVAVEEDCVAALLSR